MYVVIRQRLVALVAKVSIVPWRVQSVSVRLFLVVPTCKKTGKHRTCDLSERIQRSNANKAARTVLQENSKLNTGVGKASVRSEGQSSQALYAADVTPQQLPSTEVLYNMSKFEAYPESRNPIPRFRFTSIFSSRLTPRG